MRFKTWLETVNDPEQHPYNNFERQRFLPFMQKASDERIDTKRVLHFKSPQSYASFAANKGRNTEMAAEKILECPIGSPMLPYEETIERVIPNAVIVPAYEIAPTERYPQGIKRPDARIAFVVTNGYQPWNPNRKIKRIAAFYQGYKPRFDETSLKYANPIGGLLINDGNITHAWVHYEHRHNPNAHGSWSNYKLYRSLREFASSLGFFDLKPGDKLTSKSFRAADAKYQYRRAKELNSGDQTD